MTAEFRMRDAGADRRMADTPALRAYLARILRYPLSGHALPALLMFTLFLWLGLQSIFGIALLAEQALQAKRLGLFERLVRDSDARYAGQPAAGASQKDLESPALALSAAAVSLAFLRAKYWYEHQRDEAKAREALKPLLAETQHPQHRQIAVYARALGALS